MRLEISLDQTDLEILNNMRLESSLDQTDSKTDRQTSKILESHKFLRINLTERKDVLMKNLTIIMHLDCQHFILSSLLSEVLCI